MNTKPYNPGKLISHPQAEANASKVTSTASPLPSYDAEASLEMQDADNPDDIPYRVELEEQCKAKLIAQRKLMFAEDNRYCFLQARELERSKAKRIGFQTDAALREQHANDPDFLNWNPNRALDIQDYAYLHFHRQHFDKSIQEFLEIIAAKITHVGKSGKAGYFNKLERNIGWTPDIVPLIFTRLPVVDKLVRCSLWSNAHNSRRCHKPDLCPNCLWNDFLKIQVQAFGSESGAFYRTAMWLFTTLSFTTSKANSKATFKTMSKEDYALFHDGFKRDGLYGGSYDPAPVRLGDDTGDLSSLGMDEARTLWAIAQQAMESLYPQILDGYKTKLEGMFRIHTDGVRVLPHLHAIANSQRETNGDYIAQRLFEEMQDGLVRNREWLSRDYYPNVHVFQIPDPVALEKCIVYCEKVVPIGLMVTEAMALPQAKNPDGSWNHDYVHKLIFQVTSFVQDLTENLFAGLKYASTEMLLRRRKTVGNLVFSDKNTCIGDEPGWHARRRHKKAESLRKARQQRKKLNKPPSKKTSARRKKPASTEPAQDPPLLCANESSAMNSAENQINGNTRLAGQAVTIEKPPQTSEPDKLNGAPREGVRNRRCKSSESGGKAAGIQR